MISYRDHPESIMLRTLPLLASVLAVSLIAEVVLASWPDCAAPSCGCPCDGPLPVAAAATDQADRAAIRKVLDDQVAAWNKGDLEAFMAGYWSSEKLSFYSGKTRTHGWQATLERYRQRYQAGGKEMGQLRFELFHVDLLGPDAAVVRGRFQLTLKKQKDQPEGLFTLLLRRMSEGWRIVHDHTSS
jgi:beta-aspartyl-peptidase (threonine type)